MSFLKTICVAGKNDIAVDVMLYCKNNYPNIKTLFINNKNELGVNSWQKSAKWFAEKNNIEIVKLSDVYGIDNLIFLSLEFDKIITPNKFKTKQLFNIHFSMLPKYKGCFPAVLPILYGETITGVTLHCMKNGIDTGEIIDQQEVAILGEDSSLDLYKKLIKNGTEVVIRNLDRLLNNDYETKRQDKLNSYYYPGNYIDYSNLQLETNRTAFQIQNQIRAFNFRPYQILKWNEDSYIDSVILDDVSMEKPGTVLENTYTYTKIATIDYDILLYKDTFYNAIDVIKSGGDARKLCDSNKIIESQDEQGWSLLSVAVYNNNFKMVKWLVDRGADIRVVSNNGTTLLMLAKDCFKRTRDATIFGYLVEQGLDLNQKDYYGLELADYCVQEGISEIGSYVYKRLQANCLINITTKYLWYKNEDKNYSY